jgi:methylated-DNA-[protein]-cysteine S-methyltransferase
MLTFSYAYLSTPLGTLRIKGTENSIHEVGFVDQQNDNDLHITAIMQTCMKQLEEYFDGKRTTFDIVLNPAGTSFQQTVWDELKLIPFGKTTSYTQLSTQLGSSQKVRAVANAIGKNPLCILIPCHRVIGSDGDLTGFAWGIERKRWLIQHEQKIAGTYMQLF